MNWTPTYCDLTHLIGLHKGFYATVQTCTSWSSADLSEGLRTLDAQTFRGDDHLEAAKTWVEKRATELRLMLESP